MRGGCPDFTCVGKPVMIAAVASKGRHAVVHAIDELDLAALGRAMWRRKGLIAALTLLAAGLAFAAVNLATPRYKSEARVLIETRDNIFLRPDADTSAMEQEIDRQVYVLYGLTPDEIKIVEEATK